MGLARRARHCLKKLLGGSRGAKPLRVISGEEFGEEPEFETPDGRRVTRRVKFVSKDQVTQVNQVELIYHVTHTDGHKERLVQSFAVRYLFRYEMEHLLARCGFEVEAVYGDFKKGPVGPEPPQELIFVARPF